MGNYRELIFAAKLKEDTPNSVITTLQYMMDGANVPENLEFDHGFLALAAIVFL